MNKPKIQDQILLIELWQLFVVFTCREKFILEQEIKEKEEVIRQQNSDVQVRSKRSLEIWNFSWMQAHLCSWMTHILR